MTSASRDTHTEMLMLLAGSALLMVVFWAVLLGPMTKQRPPAGLRTAIGLLDGKSPQLQVLIENGLKSVSRSPMP
jgi:hypothetical protein